MSTQPVALVTGTSSGIGRATAFRLADLGYRVVATVRAGRDGGLRDEVAARTSTTGAIDVRDLDVTDLAAAHALVADVAASNGRLDLLVNNAGRGRVATLEQLAIDDLRDTLEANFVAVAALTKAALPHLRAVGGRVVTVSSVGGAVGQPFNDAYCAAKFAVEGLMQSLAPVAERLGVGVHIVEPGPVATSFVDNVGRAEGGAPAAAQDGAAQGVAVGEGDDPYAELFAAYIARTEGAFASAQSADEVAEVVVRAATKEGVPFRLQTSERAAAFAGLSLGDLDGSRVLGATRGFIG